MNLPNKITLTRILMIPVFILVFFLDAIPCNKIVAAIIFLVAALTDALDGHIARSRNLVTNLGKFLDPIADKVLVSTAMVLLLAMKDSLFVPYFNGDALYILTVICVAVILAREFMISAFRQIAVTAGIVMAAEKLGKYKTACQDLSLFVLFLAADLSGTVGLVFVSIGLALFAIATVLTIHSGVSYIVKYRRVFKDAPTGNEKTEQPKETVSEN